MKRFLVLLSFVVGCEPVLDDSNTSVMFLTSHGFSNIVPLTDRDPSCLAMVHYNGFGVDFTAIKDSQNVIGTICNYVKGDLNSKNFIRIEYTEHQDSITKKIREDYSK